VVGCLSVCLSHRSAAAAAWAGLLLSALWAVHVSHQWRALALGSNGTTARHSAANAGSVMLTAELMRLNADYLVSQKK